MRVLPFNFTVYLSFMRGFTCHRVSMSTCCNNVECHWGNMARDLVFCPHPSITVPSALIKSAVHLLYRLLVSHRKNACPSPHLTKSKPSVVKMILTHTHTHTSLRRLQTDMRVGFQFPVSVWQKNGNTRQVMNERFIWAVAYLNVSVWLIAASITRKSLFKTHQLTIEKSGSKEGELGEWTDTT